MRIIRDTIPANGFDNGIRVRLTDKDEFAIKDGGYEIVENVITDSIVGVGVTVQVKNSAGGTLSLRTESKKGDVISKCELPTAGDSKWTDVQCSNLPKLKGIQDFYLTAEGLGGETLVGNIKFGDEPLSVPVLEKPVSKNCSVTKIPNGYRVHFAESGSRRVYLLNSMGQVVSSKNVNGTEVEFRNLPQGRYVVKVNLR